MPSVCRVGDIGVGICTQHEHPVECVVIFTSGDPTVTANGIPVVRVGDYGITSCGHTAMAMTGAASVVASGPPVHRVGDSGVILGGGFYQAVTGSPDVFAGDGASPPTLRVAPGVYSMAGILMFDSSPEGRAAAIVSDSQYLPPGDPKERVDAPPVEAPPPSYQTCGQLPEKITLASMSTKVSPNFFLGTCKNVPVDQRGLTANKIACNWLALCQTILEPIRAAGFTFGFNSGFRTVDSGMGNTDHGLGCAADISCGSTEQTIAMFKWLVASGLPFSQVIYEKHNSAWVHVSYRGKPQSDQTRIMWTFTGSAPYGKGGPSGINLPPSIKP